MPAKLTPVLASSGLSAVHVTECDLDATSDRQIWEYVVREGAVIMTKDSDFVDLAVISGKGRVILLAVGNLRLRELCEVVATNIPAIAGFLSGPEQILALVR